jgi:uncharacterized membrane protein (DUF485 family)
MNPIDLDGKIGSLPLNVCCSSFPLCLEDLSSFILLVLLAVFALAAVDFVILSPGAGVHLGLPLGFFIPLWHWVTTHVFLRAGAHRAQFFSGIRFEHRFVVP